jgi:alanyl-tRNA synthetase
MMDIDAKGISKDALRKEFSKHPSEYYSTKIFEEKGFKRQKCKFCGKNFWSIKEKDSCGDSSHTEYGFFRDKPREISYFDFWKKFSQFFKDNGHEVIKRYPVVSRWRPDLYFTIAGIQDFQRLENGKLTFEYGANPLMVPQPCMRFSDLENAGVSGRHFTTFVMANQTAFDYPKHGYWRDRTIKLNFELLTKVLEVPEDEVVYHEDVWAMPDFSGFGPCLENATSGLEICNNVFTQFSLRGNKVEELDSKVVDVGWGLNRLLWYYTGHTNAYEANFRGVLAQLRKDINLDFDEALYRKFAPYAGRLNTDEIEDYATEEKKALALAGITKANYDKRIKPLQALYAVIDYTSTLLFAITDGGLPSNIGGGYNLRLVLRRSLDFIDKYKIGIDMGMLAGLIAKDFREMYPELSGSLGTLEKVMEIEKQRYSKAKENAKRVVELMLEKSSDITKEQLKTVYQSNGVTPELISGVAASKGIEVKLPAEAYKDIIQSDMVKKEKEKKVDLELPRGIEDTKPLYYDFVASTDAKVLFAKGKYFVLDKTPFYPESGGQVQDLGTVNGTNVVDVQKIGNVVVHVADKDTTLKKGDKVVATVDEERRKAVIAHHTATHMISAATRKLLGDHAWQEGAKKEAHKAHIDIVHYDKLSEKQVDEIERQVNSWIFNGIKVGVQEMSRGDAESKYGFSIYQGHGVPAKTMRIVTIKTLDNKLIDAEACGGLHAVGKESYVGIVKIISTSRIHDGVDRIEFVSGPAALKLFRNEHNALAGMASKLNVEPDPDLVSKRLFDLQEDDKALHKQLEKNSELLADGIAEAIPDSEFIEKEVEVDRKAMIKIADLLIKRNSSCTVLLKNKKAGYLLCMSGSASKRSAIETIKAKLQGQNFNGGGSAKFAEARI